MRIDKGGAAAGVSREQWWNSEDPMMKMAKAKYGEYSVPTFEKWVHEFFYMGYEDIASDE